MSDPVGNAYGTATWQDFTHNWRQKDSDWLQKRSVLRYDTNAARNAVATHEVGQVIYNLETDRLELRKKDASWAGLYTIDGLIIEPSGSDIKMRHPTVAGTNGLVFTTAGLISTQLPIVTAGNQLRFEATGLTINTGTKVAKLTTDASYLKSDAPISAPGLVSSTSLSVATTSTFTGAITASTATFSGLVTCNGYVALQDAPTATTHATNKAYVDGQIGTRLSTEGGYLTGWTAIHQDDSASGGACFRLRDVSNKPYMDWMDWAGNQLGWIQGTTANLTVYAKGDILLNSGGGQVRTSDAIFTTGGINRFFSQAHYFIGSSNTCYLAFFGAGSNVDTMGSRYGYIGYSNSGYLYHINEVNSGSNFYQCDYAHVYKMSTSGSTAAQVEMGRWQYNVGFMVKRDGNYTHTVEGHVLWNNGLYYSTTTHGDAATNFYVNRLAGAHGDRWMWFGKDSVWIASIYQNGTTGAVFATTSDYRAKTIVSKITDATERFMALRTYRTTWNGDPDRGVTDEFMAHEVQAIVPDAVLGEKDAVDEDGNPVHQQMAEYRLMPLTVATLQETIERVAALERNLSRPQAA